MLQNAVIKKTRRCLIFLTSPSGITHTHTPIITNMLNAALPTMVPGPSSPDSKPCPHTCHTQMKNNTTMCPKLVIMYNLIYNMFSSMTYISGVSNSFRKKLSLSDQGPWLEMLPLVRTCGAMVWQLFIPFFVILCG